MRIKFLTVVTFSKYAQYRQLYFLNSKQQQAA